MSTLLMGKCLGPALRQTVRVLVPKLKLDSFLNMHFRENEQILAHDLNEECGAGDWVLIRQMDHRLSLEVNHKVEKIVYSSGHIIDPLSGKQSLGYEFVEDADKQSLLFGLKPNTQR